MPAGQLSAKQRRHLRALAHNLRPLAHIGKEGVSAGVVAAVKQALLDHELVKVKFQDGSGLDRHQAAELTAKQTGSQIAQVLGNVILLYRPHPDEPTIVLPR
jgi:RNA-binding protein